MLNQQDSEATLGTAFPSDGVLHLENIRNFIPAYKLLVREALDPHETNRGIRFNGSGEAFFCSGEGFSGRSKVFDIVQLKRVGKKDLLLLAGDLLNQIKTDFVLDVLYGSRQWKYDLLAWCILLSKSKKAEDRAREVLADTHETAVSSFLDSCGLIHFTCRGMLL
jgi:hypothetical protein